MKPPILDTRIKTTGRRVFVVMGVLAALFASAGCEVETPGSGTALFWVEAALVLLVFLLLPVIARCCGEGDRNEARGLGLPRGSVRGMLALFIVGSTINFLLFGSPVAGEHFGEVVAALTGLTGSVIGFYFGGRTATPSSTSGSGGNGSNGSGGPGEQSSRAGGGGVPGNQQDSQ